MRLRHPIRLRTIRAACGTLFMLAVLAAPALADGDELGAPEIDPGSMVSALTLLGGGLLMLTDRIRVKR